MASIYAGINLVFPQLVIQDFLAHGSIAFAHGIFLSYNYWAAHQFWRCCLYINAKERSD